MQKKILSLTVTILLAAATALAAPVPDTGQTTGYTTTPGEDADYLINAHSYSDLGNGIVRDNVTGLEWQKATAPGYGSGYYPDRYTWAQAMSYCDVLNLGEHADWRLPTIQELATLVDAEVGYPGPAIDSVFSGTQANHYWSSTTEALNSGDAWCVDFSDGAVSDDHTKTTFMCYVRAVRGGQAAPATRFVDNEDGTVTDTLTGLMWKQASAPGYLTTEPGGYDWWEALTYCETLDFAGYDDWRLPTRNELLSIADFGTYDPAIDTTAFPDTVESYYWSSTTDAYYTGSAWYVNFYYGDVESYGKYNDHYVRAVRSEDVCCQCYRETSPGSGEYVQAGCADYYALVHDLDMTCNEYCTETCDRAYGELTDNCYCPLWDPENPEASCEEDCTLVELADFSVTAGNGKAIITFQTASEIDNAGFNLYRAAGNGPYEKITATLIPAEGSPTRGAAYKYIDRDVHNRTTYRYLLEDVDLNGVTTSHGPVSATPRLFGGR